VPNVTILPFNNIEAAQNAISHKTAAVIVEPIQGEGGIHPADFEFLQALRSACDVHDAVLIFDEVQCGVGRTGTLWAHEPSGVTPDLMALAKPLASGLPIGVTLMIEAVHDAVSVGDHGSTFAGGNLVTAVATHVLERLSSPDMLNHVKAMGDYFLNELNAINSPHIQTVRGQGLMLGIELDFAASEVVEAGYTAGFLLVNAGPNVLRLVPPLIVQPEDIDQFIAFFKAFLADYQG
jgi:acetylornithine/N-succinyldiaminopimelate aminotransferase